MTVSEAARGDLRHVARYYRREAPAQVARFRAEYRYAVGRVREWPHLSSEDRPNVRHRSVRSFPYNVFYALDEDARVVTVTAVIHHRRDPALARLRAP
ncbi:MAG: type II toxin-antitoxin system RelE/ParE family toxin [Bifidobacteriaceae bacterium]|nr:type II toxin-antitoxin system RelE/ParE family toxin [Bifidobacteriaceae bacterium]